MPNTRNTSTTTVLGSPLVDQLSRIRFFTLNKAENSSNHSSFYSYLYQGRKFDLYFNADSSGKVSFFSSIPAPHFYAFFQRLLQHINETHASLEKTPIDADRRERLQLLSETGDDLLKIVSPSDLLDAQRVHAFLELAALAMDVHDLSGLIKIENQLKQQIDKMQQLGAQQPKRKRSEWVSVLLFALSGLLLIGSVLIAASVFSPLLGGLILFSCWGLAGSLLGAFIAVGLACWEIRKRSTDYHRNDAMKEKTAKWLTYHTKVVQKKQESLRIEQSRAEDRVTTMDLGVFLQTDFHADSKHGNNLTQTNNTLAVTTEQSFPNASPPPSLQHEERPFSVLVEVREGLETIEEAVETAAGKIAAAAESAADFFQETFHAKNLSPVPVAVPVGRGPDGKPILHGPSRPSSREPSPQRHDASGSHRLTLPLETVSIFHPHPPRTPPPPTHPSRVLDLTAHN